MRLVPAALLGALLHLAGCDSHHDGEIRSAGQPAGAKTIALSDSDYARLGAETVPAQPLRYTPQVHGFGVVLNPATLAQTDADIETAEAAVLDSHAAVARARLLFGKVGSSHAVSQEALDAAEQRATADEVQLALADRREIASFGPQAPWRETPRKMDLLSQLTSGAIAIVQATFPLGTKIGANPSALSVVHLDAPPGTAGARASILWSAPSDPTIPGQSFYALIEKSDLQQGEHVLAYAETGGPVDGVQVPSEAIVLAEHKAWCYVLVAPLAFRRIEVDLTRPVPGGYFVSGSIVDHEPVLVKGTGLLLARELGASGLSED